MLLAFGFNDLSGFLLWIQLVAFQFPTGWMKILLSTKFSQPAVQWCVQLDRKSNRLDAKSVVGKIPQAICPVHVLDKCPIVLKKKTDVGKFKTKKRDHVIFYSIFQTSSHSQTLTFSLYPTPYLTNLHSLHQTLTQYLPIVSPAVSKSLPVHPLFLRSHILHLYCAGCLHCFQ